MESDIMHQILFPSPPAAGCSSQVLFPPTLPPGNSSFDKWPDSQFQENIIEYLEKLCQQIMRLIGEMRRRQKERNETGNNAPNVYHQSTSGNRFTQDSQLHNKVQESEAPLELGSEKGQETEHKLPSVDSNTFEDKKYGSEQNDRYCLSKAIQKNFTMLVEVLPYRESELSDILGESCLTDNENSRIRNQPHREDQVRQLLRTIMGRTFRVMKDFLDYSRKFNPEEVEVVWKTFDELQRESVVEKRCVLCRMMEYVDIKYVADILYERDLVPASFHGRVSDSLAFVGCQDKLWGELASLCKRPRYRSSMLTSLITALEKKEKYSHFANELNRYGGHYLTSLKCTCQSNYRTENKSSVKSTKQNRVVFCQRVESFRSSSGTTSLSPWSSHSDITTHGPSTRLQNRCRLTGLKRVSSLRSRASSQFTRRGINVKPRKHKFHFNQHDKNNEIKDEEDESTNKCIKSHDAVIVVQNALRSASQGTPNRLSALSCNSELQSFDEERSIKGAFKPQTILFKNKLEEARSIENGHIYDANSILHGEQERFEDDFNADLPEKFQKMLPSFLEDVRQFSGEDESYTSLTRSNYSPLSATRPVYFSQSKSTLLQDNTLSQDIPAIDNSDTVYSQNKSEGANIHSADKTDDNKENMIELEIPEDKLRKEKCGQFEDNTILHSNMTDLPDSNDSNIRLDDGTSNTNIIFNKHVTDVFNGRPKGRIIRRKRRLTAIPSPASLNGDYFNETENIFDPRKPLLGKGRIGRNSRIFQDEITCFDKEMKEGGDETNALNKNTREEDSDQYCKTYPSNKQVDSDIMTYVIKQEKVADKTIYQGGEANKSSDMKNRVKNMVLKDSTNGRIQGTHDAMSQSLLVSEIENAVSKEELSQGQLQRMRSRSFWGRLRHFLRSHKKEKGKK